jgi:hypothetical protein
METSYFADPGEFRPALANGRAAGSVVQLVRRPSRAASGESGAIVWQFEAADPDEAQVVFQWIDARPEQWALWGRLALGFGTGALHALVVDEASRDARARAAEAAMARDEEEERLLEAMEINLYILDKRGGRPGLYLQSRDQAEPFWTTRFSERWERERVLDWMRWQKAHFVEWRDYVVREGTMAFEQLIMAGMRETEQSIKARGLAARGNRPLRFWRGE